LSNLGQARKGYVRSRKRDAEREAKGGRVVG